MKKYQGYQKVAQDEGSPGSVALDPLYQYEDSPDAYTQFRFYQDPDYGLTYISPPASYIVGRTKKGLGQALFTRKKEYLYRVVHEDKFETIKDVLAVYIKDMQEQARERGSNGVAINQLRDELYVIKVSRHFIDHAEFHGDDVALTGKIASIFDQVEYEYMTLDSLVDDKEEDQKCLSRRNACTLL